MSWPPALAPVLRVLAALAPIVGGAGVILWRYRETRAPVTARTIVLPPVAMSTGFAMFALPVFRIPLPWAAAAFLVGALILVIPLRRSSTLELREDGSVWMERSPGFLLILLALLAVRVLLHEQIGHVLSPARTAGLFFVLAFGMILRWRVGMYVRYRRLVGPGEAPAGEPRGP